MTLVAVATCSGVDLGREEGFDVDPDSSLLLASLADVGIEARLAIWNDESVDWSEFDLVVVRSTWDYAARRDEFLAWARSVPNIVNPYPVLEFSSDKHYLSELRRRGHRVVDTEFFDVGVEPSFPDGNFVVKPSVGAGSIDAERYGPDDHARAREHVARLHARGRDVMVQPYVDSVDQVGELALVFIDGSFSHGLTKGAMLNVAPSERDWLFRREQMSLASPDDDTIALATRTFTSADLTGLLYARVDLVATTDGWAIMELELVEPSLFLSFDDSAPHKLACAIRSRIS